MARSIFRLGPLLPGDDAAERVEDGLREIDAGQMGHLPTWLRLLSLESGDAAPDSAAALRALVARLARRHPFVLLLDDWHAADDASRAMLAALRDVPSLFILMTARPESAGEVGMRDREILRLPPFDDSEIAQLLARLLPTPDPFLVREICESSGGNPLFIE